MVTRLANRLRLSLEVHTRRAASGWQEDKTELRRLVLSNRRTRLHCAWKRWAGRTALRHGARDLSQDLIRAGMQDAILRSLRQRKRNESLWLKLDAHVVRAGTICVHAHSHRPAKCSGHHQWSIKNTASLSKHRQKLARPSAVHPYYRYESLALSSHCSAWRLCGTCSSAISASLPHSCNNVRASARRSQFTESEWRRQEK